MLIMSNIGDQVWLMTSRQTDPDLFSINKHLPAYRNRHTTRQYLGGICGSRSRCLETCMGIDLGARRGLSSNRLGRVLHGVNDALSFLIICTDFLPDPWIVRRTLACIIVRFVRRHLKAKKTYTVRVLACDLEFNVPDSLLSLTRVTS